MMLKIACTCGHTGLVSAESLKPGRLRGVVARRAQGLEPFSGGDGGRPLPVENLAGGPPFATKNISGRVAFYGQLAVRCKYRKLYYDRQSPIPLRL
jgi:hypothetical protein